MDEDAFYMRQALEVARAACDQGEVPVGALIVYKGEVIARAHNKPMSTSDVTAHAEIAALRMACDRMSNYRLPECTMYVSLEPCLMCAGAIIHARLARLVFAAPDYKTGVAGSVLNVFAEQKLNHHTKVSGGLLAEESANLLRNFFRSRRC
jgi:tRNA(adenine34) deaminase